MTTPEEKDFEDFMLDLESTGTNPGVHAITSFAFLPFKFAQDGTMNFGQPFTIRVGIPSTRRIDAETTIFREAEGVDEAESVLTRYTPREALSIIQDWIEEFDGIPTIWARPTKFDIAFMESYFTEYRLEMPWHYRDSIDVRSWIRGLLGEELYDQHWPSIKAAADVMLQAEDPIKDRALNKPHAAIYDCYQQCFMIQAALIVKNANRRNVG